MYPTYSYRRFIFFTRVEHLKLSAMIGLLPCFPDNKTGLILIFTQNMALGLIFGGCYSYFKGRAYIKIILKIHARSYFRVGLIIGETRYNTRSYYNTFNSSYYNTFNLRAQQCGTIRLIRPLWSQ